MRSRSAVMLALVAALLAPVGLIAGPAAPASATSTDLVEGFEASPSATWRVVAGAPSVSPSTVGQTEGATALRIGYDFTPGANATIGYVSTPAELNAGVPTALKLDVRGDGTFNTVYVTLRDETGERFIYRIANLNVQSWATYTVDLAQPPANVSGGNGNGVLDAPISVYQVNVARNGTQPATGSVTIDNLRLENSGWSIPTSTAQVFSSVLGGSTTVSFTAGYPGDYSLLMGDESGHSLTVPGTAGAAGPVSFNWNGTDGSGAAFSGNVHATLTFDSTPDGSLAAASPSEANPYLTGVSLRNSTNLGSIVGVNSFLTTIDSAAQVDAQTKLMENAYVKYAREEFEWNRVEPRQGYYDWSKFDQAVELAQARGIQLVGKLVYTADWASSAPAGTPASDIEYYPPTNMADFAAYAKAVVQRYGDRVKVWEVWNEPNTAAHWKPGPNPAQYGAMLKAAYAAIKQADPTSTVLGGSLAGFSDDFMNGVKSAGAGDSFDALAIHTYVAGAPESSVASSWIDGANSWLSRIGAGDRKLWITEVGWSTCGGGCPNPVSEADQAAFLERMYSDASARGVRGVFWFGLMEYGTSASTLDNYGLVETSGRQKPAYTALMNVGRALNETGSAGFVSPTADGLFYITHDMDTTAPFSVAPLGGGSASITAVGPTSAHSGNGAIKLTYGFTGGSTGVELSLNRPVSGTPKAISIWEYGDASNSPIYLKITDSSGETFQAKAGDSAVPNWQRMTFYFDGSNPSYTHFGGNNDGIINYPITVQSVIMYRPTSGVQFGSVFFDDLTAHYGTITRGAVLIGHQANVQMVYSLASSQVTLPVAGTTATVQRGNTDAALTVSGGNVSVPIGPGSLTVVASTASTSPIPARPGELVGVVWRGGDRSSYAVQIVTATGNPVRYITSGKKFDSGRRTETWNGVQSNGLPSVPGNYIFRVILLGADGRNAVLDTPFSIVAP